MGTVMVISQDRNILRTFDDAGIAAIKVTSVAAAMVLLKDSSLKKGIIFIDETLKGIEDVKRLVIRKEARQYIIGSELPKPLKIEHIKRVLSDGEKSTTKNVIDEKNITEEVYQESVTRVSEETEIKQYKKKKKKTGISTLLGSFHSKGSLEKEEKVQRIIPFFVQQQVLAVTRVKGGVGTTLVATHLAKQLEEIKVCIIDLNFSDGGSDLSYYLDLPKVPHWGSFLRNKSKTGFSDALVVRDGIHILQVPPVFRLIEDIRAEDIALAINFAKNKFNIVIIDLPADFNGLVQEALNYATTTFVISEGHVSELIRIEKMLEVLENPVLVMNNKGAASARKFRDYLGIHSIVSIEEDPNLYHYAEKRSFSPPGSIFNSGISLLGEYILGQNKINLVN